MYKIIIFIIFSFSFAAQGTEMTFEEFAKVNYFAPIDKDYLELNAKCRKNYEDNGKKKAFEVILYNKDKHVFDLNKHYNSHYEGHKHLKRPFYSFTFWNWFNKVAIETKSYEFMSNTSQKNMRRNELISKELFEEIVNNGQFNIYFHYLMDNSKSKGKFFIVNPATVKSCFE